MFLIAVSPIVGATQGMIPCEVIPCDNRANLVAYEPDDALVNKFNACDKHLGNACSYVYRYHEEKVAFGG